MSFLSCFNLLPCLATLQFPFHSFLIQLRATARWEISSGRNVEAASFVSMSFNLLSISLERKWTEMKRAEWNLNGMNKNESDMA